MSAPPKDRNIPPKRAAKSPKNSHTSATAIKRQERIKEALEYRLRDYSFAEIGEQMGCDQSTVFRLVEEGMEQIIQEPAERVRIMELQRLSKLMSVAFDEALEKDWDAFNAVNRIMDRRSKLLGLDKPTKIAATDPEGNAVPAGSAPPPIYLIFGGKPPVPPEPPPSTAPKVPDEPRSDEEEAASGQG